MGHFGVCQLLGLHRRLLTIVDAIQMGIKQTEPAIPWYQDSFENINASRAWVKTMCKGKCIEYKPFQGVNAEQMETYAHYHTARRAYEAGYFSLDEKPEKPYRAKTTIIPSLPKKGSENSNRVHSTPSRNLEKPVVAAGSPKPNDTTLEKSAGTEEKSHRIMNTEKADTNLIDLDEPSKAGGNPSNAEVQLIDLAGTAVGGIGALIDLSMPEEQPKLPSDMLDMVDLFAGESSPVKDETFNVSSLPSFLVMTDLVA
ncbi:hypothetical protein K458DRAFT_22728 [Lentithecium fluviatile CBS 122367]|uniref:Uncharacterized protein n=1 Tax=Lentithecium fluviatile CBS 122367 TaxID=1168545 RepID=A0A6G1J4H8_9PLEO|nr:hypothetical protein K458DRAFT_22728 [Lentithecium fluviatile CBS 122367]